MNRTANSKRMIALAATTAMAAGLLTGCATHVAPRADLSASKAEAALAKGKPQDAIQHAEAAVQAEPRNAAYRAMLGSAYLDAGRFASAEATFGDAMKLGDNSPSTALSLALAFDGEGKYQEASALLRDWESQITPADLGLAYALSGEPGRGIQILSNAIRGGENTPKIRQNLAFAYALDGSWRDFAVDLPGEPPWRPNDLVFSPAGDIVFTDPQNWEVLQEWDAADPASPYRGGQLLLAAQDGKVTRLAKMTGFPNGLAFHPDGSLLVGLTMEHRIVQFPWLGDRVGEPRTWCRLDDRFNPDGMIFAGDRLFATGSVGDRIAIIDAGGRVLDHIDTGPGSDPTNLCLQGNTLWVTLGLPGQLVSYTL